METGEISDFQKLTVKIRKKYRRENTKEISK